MWTRASKNEPTYKVSVCRVCRNKESTPGIVVFKWKEEKIRKCHLKLCGLVFDLSFK